MWWTERLSNTILFLFSIPSSLWLIQLSLCKSNTIIIHLSILIPKIRICNVYALNLKCQKSNKNGNRILFCISYKTFIDFQTEMRQNQSLSRCIGIASTETDGEDENVFSKLNDWLLCEKVPLFTILQVREDKWKLFSKGPWSFLRLQDAALTLLDHSGERGPQNLAACDLFHCCARKVIREAGKGWWESLCCGCCSHYFK